MKDFIKYIFGLLVLVIFGLTACQKKQIVEDPITPGAYGYTLATFTTDFTGTTIKEGDTITYTIKLSKMLDRALTFSLLQTEGTADENDFLWEPVTISPYSDSAVFQIVANYDMIPEIVETAKIEIGVFGLGDRYLLDTATVNPVLDLSINPSAGVEIEFSWAGTNDFDFVIYKENLGSFWQTEYSDNAATTSNPEYDAIALSEVGTYYIDIMNRGLPSFDYTFKFGTPDGNLQTITGNFNADTYPYYIDFWRAWGGFYNSYRVIKVVNDGTNFTITKLDDLTAGDYYNVSSLNNIAWGGTDGTYSADYNWLLPSAVTTEYGTELHIDSLNYNWMQVIWGEEFLEHGSPKMIVYSNGDAVIENQYHSYTLFVDGTDSTYTHYNIIGRGNFDGTNNLSLEYELISEGGTFVAKTVQGMGYCDEPYFLADLTITKNVKTKFVKPNVKIDRHMLNSFNISKYNINKKPKR